MRRGGSGGGGAGAASASVDGLLGVDPSVVQMGHMKRNEFREHQIWENIAIFLLKVSIISETVSNHVTWSQAPWCHCRILLIAGEPQRSDAADPKDFKLLVLL